MSNLIKFIPVHKYSVFTSPFKPALHFLPEWYKEMPQHTLGDTKNGLSKDFGDTPNTTLKSCSPFLDALTTGYIFELFCDIEIRNTENGNLIRWRLPDNVVTLHEQNQFPGLPKPNESQWIDVFKWFNYFNIKTPKGYSCLFTHPFNRLDLPFRTLTGVVDTDTYPGAVQFPFQVNEIKDEFIILKKGTPLCQIIPFKRTDWKSEYETYDESLTNQQKYDFLSNIVRAYKNNFWHKKTYQ